PSGPAIRRIKAAGKKKGRTMNPLTQLKKATPLFLVAFVLACFGLSSRVQAVDPPPDGGYPNNNTAEGTDSLFSLTTGFDNTASGFNALLLTTAGSNNTANGFQAVYGDALVFSTGSNNTATGYQALFSYTTGSNNTASGYQALFHNTTGAGNTANGL